jgi:hypothetical protein
LKVQSALIVALWIAQTLAQLAVLRRLLCDSAWRRYPAFAAMTALYCGRSLVALAAGAIDGNFNDYPRIWSATQAAGLALESAACVEAFWILARHFRRTKAFGWVILAAIATVGGFGSLALRVTDRTWTGTFRSWLLATQHLSLALVVVAALALLFFRMFSTEVPIRPNAMRHSVILSTLFAGGFLASFIGQESMGQARFLTNLVLLMICLGCYGVWAMRMGVAGEVLPFEPRPTPSPDEIEALERQLRAMMQAANSGVRDVRSREVSRR